MLSVSGQVQVLASAVTTPQLLTPQQMLSPQHIQVLLQQQALMVQQVCLRALMPAHMFPWLTPGSEENCLNFSFAVTFYMCLILPGRT